MSFPQFAYQGSSTGWLLTGMSERDQAYLQSFPALTGPDAAMNRELRARTRRGWTQTTAAAARSIAVTSLPKPYFGLSPELVKERCARPVGDPLAWLSGHEYVAWKVRYIPETASRVLFLGCGGGGEIAAYRSVGGEAKVDGLDFCQLFDAASPKLFDFSFTAEHWLTYLQAHAGAYDAVFSNHQMEHVYNDPTDMLRRVAGCLRPGGKLVMAMPLEASSSNPYMPLYERLVGSEAAYAAMLDAVDCGHPWKTDVPELQERLLDAGFTSVDFYFRERGAPFQAYNDPLVKGRPSYGSLYERPRPLRSSGAQQGPLVWRELAYKWLYRAKSVTRINRLKSLRVHEVLTVATKSAPTHRPDVATS